MTLVSTATTTCLRFFLNRTVHLGDGPRASGISQAPRDVLEARSRKGFDRTKQNSARNFLDQKLGPRFPLPSLPNHLRENDLAFCRKFCDGHGECFLG